MENFTNIIIDDWKLNKRESEAFEQVYFTTLVKWQYQPDPCSIAWTEAIEHIRDMREYTHRFL